ncbi:MAG: hypothetical protein ACI8PZ_006545 [Myxococcota bacterium]|jgi:hypothetical protein
MRDRRERLPNANSPQLLVRLLEMVGRGVRSTRGLQEALGVEGRTVNYYTQAAQWLGLMDEPDLLSPLGLELLFGASGRWVVYTRAVWSTPLAGGLLALTGGELPSADQIARAAAEVDPELAVATLQRRASAVRSLIAPVADHERPRERGEDERQLALPMAVRSTPDDPVVLPSRPGEYDPDVYRYLLGELLDNGELTLGQMRSLLDRAGAGSAPIGGYVDLALGRGDARRRERRLVVTAEAVARRGVVTTTTSVILSDPGYRSYLAEARLAQGDRHAEIRRDRVAPRYLSWDLRLFGHALRPERVEHDLERVLLDRTLESFPVGGPARSELFGLPEPFLDCWEQPGLVICLPPSLAQLQGGLAAVNRMLRAATHGPDVALPDLARRAELVHGGLMHPGEPQPRSVPDARSLRLRTIMHAPYPCLVTALLLLHRVRSDRVEVVLRHNAWEVRFAGRRLGDPLQVLDRFAVSQGWIPCRRASGGLPFRTLVPILESLEIAIGVGRHVVLAERLFHQLRSSPEEQELHARLVPLIEALEGFLEHDA